MKTKPRPRFIYVISKRVYVDKGKEGFAFRLNRISLPWVSILRDIHKPIPYETKAGRRSAKK